MQTLAEQPIHCTGTIVKNRVNLPDAIRSPFSLGDDATMQFQCKRLMVIAWRAKSKKSPVVMISSSCSAGMTEVQNRKGERMQKPIAVDTYSHTTMEVDGNGSTVHTMHSCGRLSNSGAKMFFYLSTATYSTKKDASW